MPLRFARLLRHPASDLPLRMPVGLRPMSRSSTKCFLFQLWVTAVVRSFDIATNASSCHVLTARQEGGARVRSHLPSPLASSFTPRLPAEIVGCGTQKPTSDVWRRKRHCRIRLYRMYEEERRNRGCPTSSWRVPATPKRPPPVSEMFSDCMDLALSLPPGEPKNLIQPPVPPQTGTEALLPSHPQHRCGA